MKDYNEEELKDKTEDTTGEKTEEKAVAESQETDDSDYEETCYLCRRPESKNRKADSSADERYLRVSGLYGAQL